MHASGAGNLDAVKVTMMLCDAAQVSDGKLYVLGGGWSMTGPDPVPSAIALKIDVGWHEAESAHHWELFLEDADGRPVLVETPDGEHPVEVRGEFTVGRPPGSPRARPSTWPWPSTSGPLPLTPGHPVHLADGHRRRVPPGLGARVHHPAPRWCTS